MRGIKTSSIVVRGERKAEQRPSIRNYELNKKSEVWTTGFHVLLDIESEWRKDFGMTHGVLHLNNDRTF